MTGNLLQTRRRILAALGHAAIGYLAWRAQRATARMLESCDAATLCDLGIDAEPAAPAPAAPRSDETTFRHATHPATARA